MSDQDYYTEEEDIWERSCADDDRHVHYAEFNTEDHIEKKLMNDRFATNKKKGHKKGTKVGETAVKLPPERRECWMRR